MAAHDEVSALDSEANSGENEDEEENSRHSVSSHTHSTDNSTASTVPKSAFHLILQRSSLARSMKAVFEELSSTGEAMMMLVRYLCKYVSSEYNNYIQVLTYMIKICMV